MLGAGIWNGIEVGHVDIGCHTSPFVALSIVVIIEIVHLVMRRLRRMCMILLLRNHLWNRRLMLGLLRRVLPYTTSG
jgi:hypothetical protein